MLELGFASTGSASRRGGVGFKERFAKERVGFKERFAKERVGRELCKHI